MTTVQNDYWRNVESKRHNLQTETQASNELKETARHNVVSEKETNRHNVAYERETNRHNVTTENESKRHNLTTEANETRKTSESIRHNKVTETESHRSNLANEQIGRRNAATNERKAQISAYEAETSRMSAESNKALNAAKQKELDLKNKFYSENPKMAAVLYSGGKIDSKIATALLGLGVLTTNEYTGLTGKRPTVQEAGTGGSEYMNVATVLNGMTGSGQFERVGSANRKTKTVEVTFKNVQQWNTFKKTYPELAKYVSAKY